MTRYKLAFAVTKYFEYGGLQQDLTRIAEECADRGHRVELVTDCWNSQFQKPFPVHELKLTSLSNHEKNDELADRLQSIVADGSFDCVTGFTKIRGLHVYYAGDPCYASRFSETKPECRFTVG